MTQTNINIRIDSFTKQKANELFENLGMNMSTAINIFLKQCIRVNGIPFEVSNQLNNDTIQAIKDAESGENILGTFDNVEDCINVVKIKDIKD